jgi:hypothetical protein
MHETDPFQVEHIEKDVVHNHHHRCFEMLFSRVVACHLEVLVQLFDPMESQSVSWLIEWNICQTSLTVEFFLSVGCST